MWISILAKKKVAKKKEMVWASPMRFFMGLRPREKEWASPMKYFGGLLGMTTIAYLGCFVWIISKYDLFLHHQLTTVPLSYFSHLLVQTLGSTSIEVKK